MKSIFIIAALVACLNAFAIRIEYGRNVTISQPVYEDLYIAGGTVTVNAPVYGDLVVAGGDIVINDSILHDIVLVGGNVTFNGYVGDDVRCAGGVLQVLKDVAGDLVVTGGRVTINRGVSAGNLVAAGGEITLDGTVKGKVKTGAGTFVLNGLVETDLDCRGGRIEINGTVNGLSVISARTIVIGSNAAFHKDVRYWNKKGSLDFGQSLKNATATYDTSLRVETGRWYFLGAATVLGLLWYLGMALVLIMVIQYLFSATIRKAADTVFNSSLKSIGVGFLFFIAAPLAALVAFVTVIGVPVGLLLLFSYVALILMATVITSTVAANWFNNRNKRQWSYWRLVFIAFVIFILLKVTFLVPFAGWIIMIVLVCMAFGGILLSINWKRKQPVSAAN